MNNNINREKALLIGVVSNEQDSETLNEHLEELKLLAETAGAIVVGKIHQSITRVHSQYFVGKGKALQIIDQAKALKVKLIIFDDELTPSQIKNFLKLAKEIKIIDRNGLILDIFSKHAKTRESKTQVELAHLEYMLPRLTKQWSHLERQMGGIGTRAGMGESQIEIDRRLIRQRISKLKKELIQIEKERKIQSKMRNNKFRVSLVGYTNAGKSSLMKCLSGENVYIQNQLFATLDTTIRRVDLDKNHSILLSDTVGFIRKLPHNLVASFKSTLFEVIESDLILIVLDASSNQIKEHMYTINNVLTELESEDIKTMIILNKIDLIKTKKRIKFLKKNYPDAVMVSAMDHLRIDKLINSIINIMNEEYETIEISYPYSEARQISMAQRDVEVLDRNYQDDRINLKIKGPKEKILKILNQS
ncbi:MAG: GTPase HflX [Candidatus Neomarinimicrobiota bacterium]